MGILQISSQIRVPCQALLFDLDGTLVNSNSIVERLWTEWAAQHGLAARDVLQVSHGRRSEETMRLFLPPSDELSEEARRQIRQEETTLVGLKEIEGALQLLNSLPAARWAIVTSCPRKLAEIRLEAIGLPTPRLLVTAEMVKNGKPDPEGYLLAARELGFGATECVVIEDAIAGVDAGKRAGMFTVGVGTTFDQAALHADAFVPNLSGLRWSAAGTH